MWLVWPTARIYVVVIGQLGWWRKVVLVEFEKTVTIGVIIHAVLRLDSLTL